MTAARFLRIKNLLALLWLGVALVAAAYLTYRLEEGLHFRTDLTALLPREEQNPTLQRANDTITLTLSRRILIFVGDEDRLVAREAAQNLSQQLASSGLMDLTTQSFDKDRLQQIGRLYFPYRAGLLSEKDRGLLQEGKASEIADRALTQVFSVTGFADADLLHSDPFLLLPAFLASLPIPLSRLSPDEGMLALSDHGLTWVMVAAELKGEPFDLDVQKKVTSLYDQALSIERSRHPNLQILHVGALFFAKAGAETAMHETSIIGNASLLGTIILITFMFRGLRALFMNVLVIAMGVLIALSASLLIFGDLHVGALLFGVSLIGVAGDYSLQYCGESFYHPPAELQNGSDPNSGEERLRRVFIGITLGTATTVIGYLTLLLAPFPGLHQIAAFSAVGLLAAWITVILWLPLLDHKSPRPLRSLDIKTLLFAERFSAFWEEKKFRFVRRILLCGLVALSIIGWFHFHTNDDVRTMQALSAPLLAEQTKIQNLMGNLGGGQFFLVEAPDDETALQREEALSPFLHQLIDKGVLAGFQSPAAYVPSARRQNENRNLQRSQLYGPLLEHQAIALNLKDALRAPDAAGDILALTDDGNTPKALQILSLLLLDRTRGEVTHAVTLDGIQDLQSVSQIAAHVAGVRFIDPVGDFSKLLGKYRVRALFLMLISVGLMMPLLVWRYGWRRSCAVLTPSLLAVFLTPGLRGFTGGSFTFFDAMALVLILSIGVDYAVFCAESSALRKPVTIFAVGMAASTATMSFGFLALSRVAAVHSFGTTMLIGIILSFFFSPLARWVPEK